MANIEDYVGFTEVSKAKAKLLARHMRCFCGAGRKEWNSGEYGVLYSKAEETAYILSRSRLIPRKEEKRHGVMMSLVKSFMETHPNGVFPEDAEIL